MSKTYLDQLGKANALMVGLRKNYDLVKTHGISQEDLSKLEALIKEGEQLNGEAERLRAETKTMIAEANKKLAVVKDIYQDYKRIVKLNFDMTQWERFGVMDKR